MKELRSYQKEAIQRFAGKSSFFLAMEMRLGKTLTDIRLQKKNQSKKNLILAPITVLNSWEKELQEEGEDYIRPQGKLTERAEQILSQDSGFVLLNPEAVPRIEHQLIDSKFTSISFDESIIIKSPRAQITKSATRLAECIDIAGCLCGMPAPETWLDIWTQMNFIFHGNGWMGSFNWYKWRDNVARCFGYEWLIPAKSQARIKEQFHADAYVLTRCQAGIGETKVRQTHSQDLPDRVRAVYRAAEKEWADTGAISGIGNSAEGNERTDTKYAMVVSSWLRRLCNGDWINGVDLGTWKDGALVYLLSQIQGQVVIWCAFNNDVQRVWRICQREGIEATYIQGATSVGERATRTSAFQAGLRRVMIIQIRCGKYGIDLSAADTAIYYSGTYGYNERGQSEDRIVKVGKKSPLLFIDLISKDTIEEDLLQAVRDKRTDARWLMSKVKSRAASE